MYSEIFSLATVLFQSEFEMQKLDGRQERNITLQSGKVAFKIKAQCNQMVWRNASVYFVSITDIQEILLRCISLLSLYTIWEYANSDAYSL